MINLVYIAGYGRSGSTILNEILGSAEGAIGVGELANFFTVVGNDEYCSCGSAISECKFWSEIRARLDETSHFQNATANSTTWSPDFYEELYGCIAHATSSHTIVDSSKDPSRLNMLFKLPNIKLKVIHLWRHPLDVCASLKKSWGKDPQSGIQHTIKSRPIFRTAIRWQYVNFRTTRIIKNLDIDRMSIRYEDLVADPVRVLNLIQNFTGLNLNSAKDKIQSNSEFMIGH